MVCLFCLLCLKKKAHLIEEVSLSDDMTKAVKDQVLQHLEQDESDFILMFLSGTMKMSQAKNSVFMKEIVWNEVNHEDIILNRPVVVRKKGTPQNVMNARTSRSLSKIMESIMKICVNPDENGPPDDGLNSPLKPLFQGGKRGQFDSFTSKDLF